MTACYSCGSLSSHWPLPTGRDCVIPTGLSAHTGHCLQGVAVLFLRASQLTLATAYRAWLCYSYGPLSSHWPLPAGRGCVIPTGLSAHTGHCLQGVAVLFLRASQLRLATACRAWLCYSLASQLTLATACKAWLCYSYGPLSSHWPLPAGRGCMFSSARARLI